MTKKLVLDSREITTEAPRKRDADRKKFSNTGQVGICLTGYVGNVGPHSGYHDWVGEVLLVPSDYSKGCC